ncbi:hypothetical protein ACWDKQ_14510 [Saccharopolyspora sp. NPDC000995]
METPPTPPPDTHPRSRTHAAEHAELGRAQHMMRAELLDSPHNAGDYEMHLIGPLAARPVRPCPRRS